MLESVSRTSIMLSSLFSVLFGLALLFAMTSCDTANDVRPDLPPQASPNASNNPSKALKPGDQPIAQIAIDSGFTELVNALTYVDTTLDAGLVDLFLNGTDQYTVFAPTNEAFDSLYAAQGVGGITELPADLVLDVLLYHVTEGRRASNSVVPKRNTRKIETLLDEIFEVDPDANIIAIGSTATIIQADISASNGIIHVIDAVLLPI